MAKKGKFSFGDNKTIKTTLIVLVLFFLLAGIYLFFQREQKKKDVIHKALVQTEIARVSEPTRSVTVKTKTKKVTKLPSAKGAKIAFILDDWGYRMSNCHFLKEISAPLAIAVLPNLKHTDDIMKCASLYDKDIMLHLPLEPYHNIDPYPDSYLITTKMSKAKVEDIMDDFLKKMPSIVGVNNHMGSKATEDRDLMKTIFKKIRRKGLFFIDSMTAPHHSICSSLADEMKLPFSKRDVFLDNVNTREAIEVQILELAQKARRQGYAIAIGHDRQLTLQVLKDEIPMLEKQGFTIVHVKDLLSNKR